jgi:nitrate/nitrite transporter NarK
MTVTSEPDTAAGRGRVLTLSTTAFTVMFAVWLMFGVLGIPIRKEFGLTDVQLSWITSVAILNGSIWRLLTGIGADRWGGRIVMTVMLAVTAVPAYLVSQAHSYGQLLVFAFLVGFAGNSFSVGISWNSAWFPRNRQGTALGVFGAGNVGASVTKLIGPAMITAIPAGLFGGIVPGGWRIVPDVGAVGGLVGGLGGLGGFFLPPVFAYMQRWTGQPQSTFGVLFVVTALAALWMHLTVYRLLHAHAPHLGDTFEHPAEQPAHA